MSDRGAGVARGVRRGLGLAGALVSKHVGQVGRAVRSAGCRGMRKVCMCSVCEAVSWSRGRSRGVLVRDVANDSLGVAHLVRKAGYVGVLVLYSPKLPYDACKRICDANSHLIDGVASDCARVIRTFTWVATRHKKLSLEFLAEYAKLVDTIAYHYERKHTFRAAKYAHRAVWRACMAREQRLYSAAKRLTDEMISGIAIGHRIEALERIVVQAHVFRGE